MPTCYYTFSVVDYCGFFFLFIAIDTILSMLQCVRNVCYIIRFIEHLFMGDPLLNNHLSHHICDTPGHKVKYGYHNSKIHIRFHQM